MNILLRPGVFPRENNRHFWPSLVCGLSPLQLTSLEQGIASGIKEIYSGLSEEEKVKFWAVLRALAGT